MTDTPEAPPERLKLVMGKHGPRIWTHDRALPDWAKDDEQFEYVRADIASTNAGEVEKIKKDAFDHGYLIAVSNLVNGHGQGTEAEELMSALGITRHRLRQLDLTDYDRKPLDRIIRHNNERKRS